MILGQAEISLVSTVVQGGFAALCGYMVWAQDKATKRAEQERERQRVYTNGVLEKKDQHISNLIEEQKSLLMKAIQAQDRSTEVCRQVVDVIKRCSKASQ